jgi:hypothetical protein
MGNADVGGVRVESWLAAQRRKGRGWKDCACMFVKTVREFRGRGW